MFGALLLAAAQMTAVMNEDPITLKKTAFFGVEDENGSTFGLICEPGANELEIMFAPDRYRTIPFYTYPVLWQPRADSRFGKQQRAESDSWAFGEKFLTYVSANPLGSIKGKAEFIDALAKDDTFNIRYEAIPDDTRTETVHYTLNLEELRTFIWACNPRRVIQRLRDLGSPAAPPQ